MIHDNNFHLLRFRSKLSSGHEHLTPSWNVWATLAMTEADGKALITPATTPGTREDENNELPLIIPIQTPLPSKSSLYYRLSLPYSILTASTIQVSN